MTKKKVEDAAIEKIVEEEAVISGGVDQGESNQEETPNLSMADLMLGLNIVTIVSSRGAIKAEEMLDVGGWYNRVKAFVEANTPPAEEQTTEGDE